MKRVSLLVGVLAVLLTALALAACGGGDEEAEPPEEALAGTELPPAETEEAVPAVAARRTLEAPAAAITVDGDPSDWDGIGGLDDMQLEAIAGQNVEPKAASVRVAHDNEYAYVLFTVEDDYNWNAADVHLSAASAVMWNVDPGAGAHMGAEDPSGAPGIGMVDIWHWELECALGADHGGAVSGPGDGDPGNDAACNFDDEFALSAVEREDDNGAGAENSLLGVWTHTNPSDDAEGVWVFEARRPLQTGDEQDAQFAVGETALMALAYWDADNNPEGWEDSEHVQSSNQGWIEVTFSG